MSIGCRRFPPRGYINNNNSNKKYIGGWRRNRIICMTDYYSHGILCPFRISKRMLFVPLFKRYQKRHGKIFSCSVIVWFSLGLFASTIESNWTGTSLTCIPCLLEGFRSRSQKPRNRARPQLALMTLGFKNNSFSKNSFNVLTERSLCDCFRRTTRSKHCCNTLRPNNMSHKHD